MAVGGEWGEVVEEGEEESGGEKGVDLVFFLVCLVVWLFGCLVVCVWCISFRYRKRPMCQILGRSIQKRKGTNGTTPPKRWGGKNNWNSLTRRFKNAPPTVCEHCFEPSVDPTWP